MPGEASRELAVLLERRVRRVIGGDGVDGAVGERLAQRVDVLGLAQRRVHLAGGVVADARAASVSSRWCGVTSRVTAMPRDFRLAQDAHRAQRRDVRDVVARAVYSASSTSRATMMSSATRGQPRSPSRARHGALVHLGAVGERVILGVLDHGQVEVLARTRARGA